MLKTQRQQTVINLINPKKNANFNQSRHGPIETTDRESIPRRIKYSLLTDYTHCKLYILIK